MFKIIKLGDFSYPEYSCLVSEDPMFQNENFERTLVDIGPTDVLDLEKCSSWTHVNKFNLPALPDEVSQFMEQHNILTEKDDVKYASFNLIKYEEGDFYLTHCDTCIQAKHAYTCLIFCPFGEECRMLEGGELILREPNGFYEIKFDPSMETQNGRFVMVIFSIDMYHEVLPINKGTRYVFKKPLYVKKTTTTQVRISPHDDECHEIISFNDCWGGIGGGNGDY